MLIDRWHARLYPYSDNSMTRFHRSIVLAAVLFCVAFAQGAQRYRVRLGADHRHLVDQDGKPYLVQGDVGWSLISGLTKDEAELYLEKRRQQGFNSIIVNLIEHKFRGPVNRYGEGPFKTPGAGDLRTIEGLAQRVAPWISPNLVLQQIPKEQGNDVFELESKNGKLIIRASDASSAAMGLNWYLKYYRHRSISHEAGDNAKFNQAASAFRSLLQDQDDLLGTRQEFLLGNWLAQAKAMARTEVESILYERNARTQITYWGPDDAGTELHEYANKEWSGMLRDFYLPRWEMFIRELNARLDGKPAGEVKYFDFEKRWTEQRNAYPAAPSGNLVATAVRVFLHVAEKPPMTQAK